MRRWRRLGGWLARGVLGAALVVLLLVIGVLGALETGWGKDRLRSLIVSQANLYLTATLDIGRLGGSLLRGVELERVRLARNGRTLIAIDHVTVSYSIRELVEGGTVIRRLALDGLHVAAAWGPDGQWDIAGLVRRDPERAPRQGPSRPLRIDTIIIRDGAVSLGSPLSLGAVHVPTAFSGLTTTFAFASGPEGWRLDFADASFTATEPELAVTRLAGAVGSGPAGWRFGSLHVATPRSEFTVDGQVDRRQSPTRLALTVAAPRFTFQEWSGVLTGLRNIAVESAFDARLAGPAAALETTIDLRSNGGAVRSTLVLDSSVPGWRGVGTATVQRLDVARWLNRADRRSDITGNVRFDLDLQLGGHFPKGTFRFEGPHAAYLGYEADDVVARGRITDTEVQLAAVTATAYGANLRLAPSTLAIDSPFGFRFVGRADGLDLRQLPSEVPVPHVESTLAMEYDVTGRFVAPFIRGTALFGDSEFLGAMVAAGSTGSIDTGVEPFQYAGEANLSDADLNRFGDALQIDWLREPRYAGNVRGRFRVTGTGSDPATMTLDGGGHLASASIFAGQLSDAEVSIHIANGSLEGTYDGAFLHVDPAIAMADPRYAASLTGRGSGRVTVRDLLTRTAELSDYTVAATLALRDSELRTLRVTSADVDATLEGGTLKFSRLVARSPGADVEATGTLELDGVRASRVSYRVTHTDLSLLDALVGPGLSGDLVTDGTLSGPLARFRAVGEGTLSRFAAAGVTVLATTASYDVAVPDNDPRRAAGTIRVHSTFVQAFGRELPEVTAEIAYDAGRMTAGVHGTMRPDLDLGLQGTFTLDARARTLDVAALSLAILRTRWRLAPAARPHVSWDDSGITVQALDLVDAEDGTQGLAVAGTWRSAGGGAMRIAARQLSIDVLSRETAMSTRYGGTVDIVAIVGGTSERPSVAADFTVTEGRVRRLTYDRFGGHVDYLDGVLNVDVRLDQAPGVWLTAVGLVPQSVFDRSLSQQPINLAVRSSPVSLTLLEGVTDVVRNVSGQMQLDVAVIGTSRDPHFTGRADLRDAAFEVVSTGARYRNGRMALQLASDRVDVQSLRVEDQQGNPLEVTGSLGTHEMRVGDLQVAINARQFQVLNNEFGRVDVDARLNLSGEFESPKMTGRIGITGGSISVDRVLDRALFQPYATREIRLPELDPIVALNPWERMGLDVELNVPGTLRLLGDNVQVTPGTPLGLGDINLRTVGDLYLYKDPAQPLYVNGSFHSVTGTYSFQGRRFDLDPNSSINFRGDLNPELYVMVSRIISGVETRVSIVGPLQQPELRLASVPPLDPSDILSLIVFNTSTNELSALQQQQLAVRAGTLAAGFLAAPMVAALERSLGIDTLEIEPGADIRSGPRVTIGNEIAPGLVARFSRQFGPAEYDEATLEYYLSRILRIRATFSDAGSLSARSPFRRVERAGIDLLFFFSF